MKKNIIIAAVILLVLGFFVWRAQPKQVIKRQSKALISMADNVSDGVSMLDYDKLETLLGDRSEFEIAAASREEETAVGVEVI